jgi:hypothetical protein
MITFSSLNTYLLLHVGKWSTPRSQGWRTMVAVYDGGHHGSSSFHHPKSIFIVFCVNVVREITNASRIQTECTELLFFLDAMMGGVRLSLVRGR